MGKRAAAVLLVVFMSLTTGGVGTASAADCTSDPTSVDCLIARWEFCAGTYPVETQPVEWQTCHREETTSWVCGAQCVGTLRQVREQCLEVPQCALVLDELREILTLVPVVKEILVPLIEDP